MKKFILALALVVLTCSWANACPPVAFATGGCQQQALVTTQQFIAVPTNQFLLNTGFAQVGGGVAVGGLGGVNVRVGGFNRFRVGGGDFDRFRRGPIAVPLGGVRGRVR